MPRSFRARRGSARPASCGEDRRRLASPPGGDEVVDLTERSAPTLHTSTHAGMWPAASRSMQPSHLTATDPLVGAAVRERVEGEDVERADHRAHRAGDALRRVDQDDIVARRA